MPCEQSLWDASTEEQWLERKHAMDKDHSLITLRHAVIWALNGRMSQSVVNTGFSWSPFMVTVTMHGVNIQIYNAMDFAPSIDLSTDISIGREEQRPQMLSQIEKALGRCYDMIVNARDGSKSISDDAEGPLLFNSLAILRVCYIRAFTDITSLDRSILLRNSRKEMLAAVQSYGMKPIVRSDLITRVVARSFEAFEAPIRAGALFIRKTAALTWSIEHAIAGWDVGEYSDFLTEILCPWQYLIRLDRPLRYQMDIWYRDACWRREAR